MQELFKDLEDAHYGWVVAATEADEIDERDRYFSVRDRWLAVIADLEDKAWRYDELCK